MAANRGLAWRGWCALLLCGLGALGGCRLSFITGGPAGEPFAASPEAAKAITKAADSVRKAADSVRTVSHEVRGTAGPDLGGIYNRTAQADDEARNPIIVIPGILGSRLVDDASGRVVWGEFGPKGINPESPQGARLIALPMEPHAPLADLRDDVRHDGALTSLDVNILGLPIQIGAYVDILNSLGVGGYRDKEFGLRDIVYGDQHYTCFQFGYDWRRDSVENARLLHEFILEKKAYVEQERERRTGVRRPARFDLVAHSMGGLVARYYLMYGDADLPTDGSTPPATWAGSEHVERLVMVGTPNAGSAGSIEQLVNGVEYARVLPRYDAAILGTMPAVYQLMPRARHVPVVEADGDQPIDPLSIAAWERFGWGLLDPDQDEVLRRLLPDVKDAHERRRIAVDHLQKCLRRAREFHQALDQPATPPSGTSLHLIAGDANPTLAQLAVKPDGQIVTLQNAPGDGTVLRTSALMDERAAPNHPFSPRLQSPISWSSVMFLFTDHLGMTSDPAFTDNVLFLLLESPRTSTPKIAEFE